MPRGLSPSVLAWLYADRVVKRARLLRVDEITVPCRGDQVPVDKIGYLLPPIALWSLRARGEVALSRRSRTTRSRRASSVRLSSIERSRRGEERGVDHQPLPETLAAAALILHAPLGWSGDGIADSSRRPSARPGTPT